MIANPNASVATMFLIIACRGTLNVTDSAVARGALQLHEANLLQLHWYHVRRGLARFDKPVLAVTLPGTSPMGVRNDPVAQDVEAVVSALQDLAHRTAHASEHAKRVARRAADRAVSAPGAAAASACNMGGTPTGSSGGVGGAPSGSGVSAGPSPAPVRGAGGATAGSSGGCGAGAPAVGARRGARAVDRGGSGSDDPSDGGRRSVRPRVGTCEADAEPLAQPVDDGDGGQALPPWTLPDLPPPPTQRRDPLARQQNLHLAQVKAEPGRFPAPDVDGA